MFNTLDEVILNLYDEETTHVKAYHDSDGLKIDVLEFFYKDGSVLEVKWKAGFWQISTSSRSHQFSA